MYRRCDEFMADMELVFSNCYLYNGQETEIGKQCTSVKLEFQNLCQAMNIY